MKRILLAGTALVALTAAQAAFAADVPVYKGPAPVAYAPFSWNGCYVGINAGGGWGNSDLGATTPGAFVASASTSGWLAGGQLGCNWQSTPGLVWGLEGDIDWANITGSGPILGTGFTYQSKLNYFGTVRGRVGAAMDRALLYVTGGFAWGNHTGSAVAPGVAFSDTQTHFGWVGGLGLEYALGQNWSAKIEYLYLGLGSKTYAVAGFTGPINVNVSTLKVGLNWRF